MSDFVAQTEQQLQIKAGHARKKLLTKELLFFGINLYKYDWRADHNCPETAGAYVAFTGKNLTELAAGSIFLNGKLISKPDFTHLNLTWFLIHEQLHVLNSHGSRMGDREPLLWNLATDHVIERVIKDIHDNEKKNGVTNVITPYGGIERANIIPEVENDLPNGSAEEVYVWLINNRNNYEISELPGSGGKDSDQPNSGSGNGGPKWFQVKNKKTGKTYVVSDNKLDTAAKKAERQAQSDARAAFENIKDKGNMPAGLSRYLEEILKIEIPWTQLLEDAIKQHVEIKPAGRSWHQLNKFFAPHNLTLPGVGYEEENTGVGTMIVGVDTSGSISRKETAQFASIIMDAVKYFKTVRVLVHDVNVHQDLEYDKDNILEFGKLLKETGFSGGGGTSHKPVFNKINTLWDEDPDSLSMCIFLTDGYSDVEQIWRNFEWSGGNKIPTYFVITSSGRNIDNIATSEFKQINIKDTSDSEEL